MYSQLKIIAQMHLTVLNALGSSFDDLTPKMANLPGQILVLHEADSDDNPVHAFPP